MSFGLGEIRGRPAQPFGPVRLIRGHPLARGLLLSCFQSVRECQAGKAFDHVSKTYGTGSGSNTVFPGLGAAPWASVSGAGYNTTGAVGGYQTRLYGARFNGSSHWARLPLTWPSGAREATFSFWLAAHALTGGVVFEAHGSGGPHYGYNGFLYSHGLSPSNLPISIIGYNVLAGNVRRDLLSFSPTNVYHHYTIRADRNGGYPNAIPSIMVDGVLISNGLSGTSGGGFVASDFSSGYFDMGARDGGASDFASISLCAVNVWSRLLSDREVVRNYLDSFQMFESEQTRRIFLDGIPTPPSVARPEQWFLTS